ncbi:ROK family transcriptional regulator [Okibacterium endophyticum]
MPKTDKSFRNVMLGTNGPRVKRHNEALVLSVVRNHGPVARAWIADRLDLEFQTVSVICSRLIERGLLMEKGTVDGLQRQSRALVVNPLAAYSIGVELNRQRATVVLTSFDGNVLGRDQLDVLDRSPEDVLADVARAIPALLDDSNAEPAKLSGVGISVPGPIDKRSGSILEPTNFSDWHHRQVGGELAELTGLPVWIENTATSAALGEQWAAGGVDNLLYVYLGVGIGIGAITEGRAVHGSQGNAGEFAHMVVDPSGPACSCGQRGCLVQYATPGGLLHLIRRAWLDEMHREPGLDLPMPADAAALIQADAPAWLRAAGDAAFAIVGRTIAQIAVSLDQERIVLGGPTTDLFGQFFLRHTDDALSSIPLFGRQRPEVSIAGATGDAGPIGAASLPFHALYSPHATGGPSSLSAGTM